MNSPLPMPNTVICPACGAELDLGQPLETLTGATIQCPACNHSFPLTVPEPAPAPPAERPKIRLRTEHSTLTSVERKTCPHCQAEIAAEAVFCVLCGTDLQTGRHVSGAGPGSDVLRQRSPVRQTLRAIVGVLAVAVIVGSLWHIYASHRSEQVTAQSRVLGAMILSSRHTHQYAASISRLEDGLAKNPLATNRTETATELARLRAELEQVPARSAGLQTEIDRTRTLTNLTEAIALLRAATARYPGATNDPGAVRLIADYQQKLRAARNAAAAR